MCDCCIDYEKGWRDDNDTIVYCLKHAAADDLYEALKYVLEVHPPEPWSTEDSESINKAQEALLKAEGKDV